jgi:membrane-bound lytic murein transglycosylase B
MKLSSMKRTAVAGVAALTLVGASLGAVAAQQAPVDPGQPAVSQQQGGRQQQQQQLLAALAARLGISTDQLQQAMDGARADVGIPERGGPNGGGPGGDRGPGGPNDGDHRQGGGPGGGQQRMGGGLDAAAQALGISADQLRQELQGQTLTQVAQAHNVDPTTVSEALKQAAYARIDQDASAGRIPADQVDTARQRVSDRVDQMMSQTAPAGRSAEGGPSDRGPGGWGQGGRAARDGDPGASR